MQLERDRGADLSDRLGRVGDHDEPLGRRGDDLLARVGAAAALDQPAVGGDLVGAVDRDVEAVEAVELLDLDPELRAPARWSRPRSRRSGSRPRGRRAPAAGGRPSSRSRARRPFRRRPARRPPRRQGASRRRGPRPTSNPIPRLRTALVRLRSNGGRGPLLRRARRARRQHDPHAVDRRDPEGELGAPGHADGARAGRVRALAALPALRPGTADLAEPRPLRALGGPRIDAPLLAAAPRRGARGRLRIRGRGARVDHARRHQEVSSARLEVRRAPGVPLDVGDRDDDRAARPGGRDLGRDGGRLEVAGRVLQPARVRAVRLRHLRDRRRRLPDGGRFARGRLVRRPPAARQPLLDLRQQPHHDRRPDRDHLRRRRRPPLRGLRLERDHGRRREQLRRDHPRPRRLQGHRGPADADHRRQPHRVRLAAQAGHRRCARRAARRRGGA